MYQTASNSFTRSRKNGDLFQKHYTLHKNRLAAREGQRGSLEDVSQLCLCSYAESMFYWEFRNLSPTKPLATSPAIRSKC